MSLSILLVLVATGCGPKLASVRGKVALTNQPVSNGVISFQPESGTTGPSEGCEFTDGQYSLPHEIVPGTYRVEIRAWQETGKMVTGPLGLAKERVNIIPKRYWGETTVLKKTIQPGANVVDFDLEK